eukprot:6187128-Pleurochrysis_carterae.AAC.2
MHAPSGWRTSRLIICAYNTACCLTPVFTLARCLSVVRSVQKLLPSNMFVATLANPRLLSYGNLRIGYGSPAALSVRICVYRLCLPFFARAVAGRAGVRARPPGAKGEGGGGGGEGAREGRARGCHPGGEGPAQRRARGGPRGAATGGRRRRRREAGAMRGDANCPHVAICRRWFPRLRERLSRKATSPLAHLLCVVQEVQATFCWLLRACGQLLRGEFIVPSTVPARCRAADCRCPMCHKLICSRLGMSVVTSTEYADT